MHLQEGIHTAGASCLQVGIIVMMRGVLMLVTVVVIMVLMRVVVTTMHSRGLLLAGHQQLW